MNDEKMRDRDRHITELEQEEEELAAQSKVEERRAQIRELKAKYGHDWRKYWKWIKSIKVDRRAAHDMFGVGDASELRELNDPRSLRQ